MGWNNFPQLHPDELILSFRGEQELLEPLRTPVLVGCTGWMHWMDVLVGCAAVCNLKGSFKERASCEGSKGAQGGTQEKGLTKK